MALIRSFLLVCIVAAVSSLPSAPILGGDDAVSGQYQYVVSVRVNGAHICGGSIIDKTHILTAAHCVDGVELNAITVRAGSQNQFAGGKILNAAGVKVPPNYSKYVNDIAVLTLDTELVWSNKIAAIELATTTADEPAVGSAVTAAGWGQQDSTSSAYKLQHTTFNIATEAECLDAFSGKDESNLCLSHELHKGSCRGDGGNGAVYKNKLVAVANFVIGACGSRYPEVFANVVHHSAWIKEALAA